MTTKVLLTVKTDKKLKEEAQQVAKDMGVPLGTIINAQLRALTRERRFTFAAPLEPNEKTKRALASISQDTNHKNWHGPFTTTDDVQLFLDTLKQ